MAEDEFTCSIIGLLFPRQAVQRVGTVLNKVDVGGCHLLAKDDATLCALCSKTESEDGSDIGGRLSWHS